MPYCCTVMIQYDFDNPRLRGIQREIKELGAHHQGKFIWELDEWGELRISFKFPCRIFLCNFLIAANENYADALFSNVWKEDKK